MAAPSYGGPSPKISYLNITGWRNGDPPVQDVRVQHILYPANSHRPPGHKKLTASE